MSDMRSEQSRPTIFADDLGIHFSAGEEDIVVVWGEIAAICASRQVYQGTTHIEVFVDHFTGVDFRFQSGEAGYEQTTAEMEKHLIGFDRAQLEVVRISPEDGEEINDVWVRDEAVQPFQMQPDVIDPRDPTPDEVAQMETARRASIASSEQLLGRPLHPEEVACIHVWFENGRIMGNTTPPLSQLLIERHNAKYYPRQDAST
ncbi:MAG: hypothetical protein IPL52_08570 [Flavobacteriales bacterium]|nr:hypothetical protein [Flavobacteriales bacterium]